MTEKISRRGFLGASAAIGAGLMLPGQPVSAQARGRVIILGFDGVEPTIVDKMLDAGELPNLDKLRKIGGYQRLRSTIPPQSPTAWCSFSTCKNPGGHGIYDFLRRDPARYMPGVGLGSTKHAELAEDGSVKTPATFHSFRKGETFWMAADRQGAKCKILNMPFCFPPDGIKHGAMLSGLGVPDLRGTDSTFFSFSDKFTPEQLKSSLAGGMRLALNFEGDTAVVKVPGARDTRQKSATYAEVPMSIKVDRAKRQATFDIQGKTFSLGENSWSDWVEWSFAVTPKYTVKAISRLYLFEAGDEVRLYMTCLQFDPRDPCIAFSTPKEYAAELAERGGLYKTIGWNYDTHALRQDVLTEDVFLDDVRQTMAWHETLTLEELDRDNWDLLMTMWMATDRVAHLFWRYRDPEHPMYDAEAAKKYGRALEDTYLKMDAVIAKVLPKLRENDLLIVMSDHGFGTFRKGFNVGTWLVREGYLAVKGQTDPATAVNDQPFLMGYDWARTKAYALGLGSIYLNLKGREGQGIVDPKDAPALCEEIRKKLLEVKDPDTGKAIFKNVYTREVYSGEAAADAPDLELGYDTGYQSTKDAAKGAAPKNLLEPNMDKWSGDHVATDVDLAPGILFSNQKLADEAAIIDLGVTTMKYLGLTPVPDHEGKSLI
jgi:predicted AlkP superfamily phosphohydrolase/phosphomutase